MYTNIALILLLIGLSVWYIWSNIYDDYMEKDPTIMRLKLALLSEFPDLNNVKMIKSNSSYTINKRKIYICTEHKGINYDDNMLIYVILHELAHVKSSSIGHGPEFIYKFNQLLFRAAKSGLWDPNKPKIENYCKS